MFWFSISTIARPAQTLALSHMEITTLGYIVCGLATTFFWRHKPMDVQCPEILICSTNIKEILCDSGDAAADTYRFTPLDFASRKEWAGSVLWRYYVNLLHKMNIIFEHQKVRPIQRFSSFSFPPVTREMALVTLSLSLVYSGIFVIPWNFYYITETERILWHICSVGIMVLVVVGGAFEISYMLLKSKARSPKATGITSMKLRKTQSEAATSSIHALNKLSLSRVEKGLRAVRNNTPDKDPYYDVGLHSLIITTPLCALYTIFRAFILVEDIIALRQLPASSYGTVDWTLYFPHF
jgi:hypothetical protein